MFIKNFLKSCGVLSMALFIAGPASAASPREKHLKRMGTSPAAAKSFVEASHGDRKLKVGTALRTQNQSNVMLVHADPQLLIRSNSFDLAGMGIHFQPTTPGRYSYELFNGKFDGTAAQILSLEDDASYELRFKNFHFPLGKDQFDRCFVNSNGNITFSAPDTDPPAADSFTSGSPRIAALFNDLDPEAAGTVFVNQTSDKVTISWLHVPEFFNQAQNQFDYGQNTFQITLHNDGGVDVVYSTEISATQAFVGIIAGNAPLHLVDFTKSPVSNRPLRSFVEDFHEYESIDIPLLMKSIYTTTSDRYDFVTLLSNFDLTPVPGAQAFSVNVRNNVRGIGNPGNHSNAVFRDNDEYGSARRLQNITFLGNLHGYPTNIVDTLPDSDTSILSILAHEVAHRWLAYIRFPDNGKKSKVLLGRDASHWSFFLDSSGSFLEGNNISAKTSNSFITLKPFQRYSELDLYLMGLLAPTEVHDSFYVEGPSDFSPDFPFNSNSDPESDVRFRGTMIPARISDVIQANGARKPSAGQAQKEFTHLFVLIDKNDHPATAEEIAYIDLLRKTWEDFFTEATGKRAKIDTNIR